ncbi:uncharacterized protein [Triticum aestivum]|uniref:uncharacterized protein n=1 Tax=Triticum aestivum TaxID=4565 RepID=UPI001D034265|nr:uncharacterized protein LOC123051235 [Triticum aestivum]
MRPTGYSRMKHIWELLASEWVMWINRRTFLLTEESSSLKTNENLKALLTVPNGVHDMGSLQVKSNQKDLTVSGQILSLEHIPGSNLGQTETTVDSLFEYTIQNGHGVILLGNVLMVPGNFGKDLLFGISA